MTDTYLGTKRVKAEPMTRLQYNLYRGWGLPEDEDGSDLGYLVEYLDGGKPNHPSHKGYISWSPAEQFDNAYVLLPENTKEGLLVYFAYELLPKHLQVVSKPFGDLALLMSKLPNGTEKSAGMRKLLEAKDCFVRASLT